MLKIGCHLSILGGYEVTAKKAVSLGANVFQYFSRNPRGGSAREVDKEDILRFLSYAKENGIGPVLAHAPYTLNLASGTKATRDFAEYCLTEDLKTLAHFGDMAYYTFHPGSHTGLTVEEGEKFIIDALNRVVKKGTNSFILLESMSGKGTEIGSNFTQLARIIESVDYDKLCVCLDTCHLYSAGYDIVNYLDGVIEELDKIIGLNKVKAVHLNDSMMSLGSHKDRHAKIGEGTIGADALVKFVNHSELMHLPFYLETPNEEEGYASEIAFFKANFLGQLRYPRT